MHLKRRFACSLGVSALDALKDSTCQRHLAGKIVVLSALCASVSTAYCKYISFFFIFLFYSYVYDNNPFHPDPTNINSASFLIPQPYHTLSNTVFHFRRYVPFSFLIQSMAI